jgi:hypothetical protein
MSAMTNSTADRARPPRAALDLRKDKRKSLTFSLEALSGRIQPEMEQGNYFYSNRP